MNWKGVRPIIEWKGKKVQLQFYIWIWDAYAQTFHGATKARSVSDYLTDFLLVKKNMLAND